MAAYAALASLAQTTHRTTSQYNSHFSTVAEEKIRSIHEYVIFLLSFLEDFPEKAIRWESKMRDVAHETEDIIEQFMWEQSHNRWIQLSIVKVEDQLRTVTEKFCLMAGDMIDEQPAISSIAVSSSSSSSKIAPSGDGAVIGLDDDLMAIKDRLCGLSSELQIIPIVGMGGIGKTTLARTAYDDQLIIRHFHIRVWLTISQDYSAHKILLSLLDSMKLIEEEMCGEGIDNVTVVEKVYKNLIGRRYLIVLDDVWSTKVWDDVRKIFPDDGNGSRIMLTTRLAGLATYPDSNSPLHEMQFMNDSQSWVLLKGKVFANSNCPLELEDVGKQLARSCGGLPLAVVLVAGLILSAVSKSVSSWKEIAKTEIAKTVKPIVGQELEGILSLSYTHLPHHLRPCFLYMGVYPEDENIRASTLIKLWLAEGFLKHKNGCSKSMEEEAEEYLEDLVNRNLVIVTSRKSNGKIKCCSLHDIVRDLCIRKAHQDKFIRVMDGPVVPQCLINERRISFKRSGIDQVWGPTIRTIICFQDGNCPSSPAFWGRFRLLRVLEAKLICIREAMDDSSKDLHYLFELFHLRYLDIICFPNIASLISNLINLQTLIIHPIHYKWKIHWKVGDNTTLFSLPLEIWRMSQLRHLVLYRAYMLPHPPNGSNLPLKNLQTLFYIKNLVWTEKILQMIPSVKRIGLVYLINKDFHLHLLKHLHQLENLQIHGFHSFSWIGHKPTFPRTLKKLTLVGGSFPWDDMTIVGSLPNLQVLKLKGYACHGEIWKTGDGEFSELRFLLIETSCLRKWITKSSHFPRLKCLVLRSCLDLTEIPEGIGQIPTLELIEVDYSNESLMKSAEQIHEDQQTYGNYSLDVRVSHFEEENKRKWSMMIFD